jgi:hypothetical protein
LSAIEARGIRLFLAFEAREILRSAQNDGTLFFRAGYYERLLGFREPFFFRAGKYNPSNLVDRRGSAPALRTTVLRSRKPTAPIHRQ